MLFAADVSRLARRRQARFTIQSAQPTWHSQSAFLHVVYKLALVLVNNRSRSQSAFICCSILHSFLLPSSSPPPHITSLSSPHLSCISFVHLPCSAPRYSTHTQQLAVVDDDITTSDSPIPHHHHHHHSQHQSCAPSTSPWAFSLSR